MSSADLRMRSLPHPHDVALYLFTSQDDANFTNLISTRVCIDMLLQHALSSFSVETVNILKERAGVAARKTDVDIFTATRTLNLTKLE